MMLKEDIFFIIEFENLAENRKILQFDSFRIFNIQLLQKTPYLGLQHFKTLLDLQKTPKRRQGPSSTYFFIYV